MHELAKEDIANQIQSSLVHVVESYYHNFFLEKSVMLQKLCSCIMQAKRRLLQFTKYAKKIGLSFQCILWKQ